VRYFSVESRSDQVMLSGEIDLGAVTELRSTFDRAVATSTGGLVVDVASVTFIDSSAINEFVRVVRAGHVVTLIGAPPRVRRTFEMLGLDEIMTLDS